MSVYLRRIVTDGYLLNVDLSYFGKCIIDFHKNSQRKDGIELCLFYFLERR